MTTLKDILARRREALKKMGLDDRRVLQELATFANCSVIAWKARIAFDKGIPMEEGPVWFGNQEWKTYFWKRQWEWQKAYREGERERTLFGDKSVNPYRQEKFPYTTRLIELGVAWDLGFKGKCL